MGSKIWISEKSTFLKNCQIALDFDNTYPYIRGETDQAIDSVQRGSKFEMLVQIIMAVMMLLCDECVAYTYSLYRL